MGAFFYVAKDEAGRVIRASVEAATRMAALATLQTRGLVVVDLASDAEEPVAPAAPRRRVRRAILRTHVPTTELAVFCRQLAISVGSGMPIRDALDSIVEDLDHPALHRALRHTIQDLHDGKPLSEALARHQQVFGPLFVALIRAAEESGSLPQTLEHLSGYLERSDRLERKIKSITAYPIFVAVFFCIVCVIMTLFVLPQFQEIFTQFDAELPLLSRVVFGINQFILSSFWWFALGGLALVLGMVAWGRTPAGRIALDRMKLRLPLFGSWLRKFAVARFARNLGMMLRGGVPVTTALEITSGVSGNKVLEQALLEARDRVVSGMTVCDSLAADPELPRLLVRMVGVGEDSGRLPEVLEKVSEVYEDQVEGAITVAMALFEPIIISLFGAAVLVLILAIYMPVFTMGASVK